MLQQLLQMIIQCKICPSSLENGEMLVHAVAHRKASKPQAAVPICLDLRQHALRCVPICGPFCVRPDMWAVLSPVSTVAFLLPVLSKQNYQQHHCPFQSSISSSSALASQTGPEFDFWFKSVTFTKPRLCFVPKPQQQQEEACLCSAFVLSCYSLHGVVLLAAFFKDHHKGHHTAVQPFKKSIQRVE